MATIISNNELKNVKFFSGNEILSNYLSDIRKYKIPTAEEEKELFERIKKGDQCAKDELINRNQRFVYSIAKTYARDENEVVDFINEGNIGLIEAIDKYDVSLGYRFLTHASWYIKREMNLYLYSMRDIITKSNAMKIGKKAEKMKQKYIVENGVNPTIDDIKHMLKEEYGIDVKNDSDLYDVNVSYIEDSSNDDTTYEDSFEFGEKTSAKNKCEDNEELDYAKAIIRPILNKLPTFQKEIIKKLFGIDCEREYGISELSDLYNISTTEIGELKDKVISFMKEEFYKYKVAI